MESGLAFGWLEGPIGLALAGVWGALWGSFFNVVIVRVPDGDSVAFPASHCRQCGQTLKWFDNLPVISYVALRGRCRYCKTSYSPRYALVELALALLCVALFQVYVLSAHAVPLGLRVGRFGIASIFCGVLTAIAFIDLATFRIPNSITYPAIPICAVLSVFMGHPHFWDGAVGAVAGYLAIRLIADGYELLTGRQGMGYGDAKLLAMIGGLLGWQALLPTLFCGLASGESDRHHRAGVG